jgi:DNA (cytosine-5)-methyltransferase 1
MRYLSICSGIEAATVGWHPLGWAPWAFAEVEAFPSAVLAHHYGSNLPGDALSRNAPPNLGDITKFKDWPDAAIDVLVGGTPCQSFSVAGLRRGIDDPRGNLALVYLAIADRYRPEWVVWENVPGVLSSSGGRDFGAFLGGLGQLGYGFAYRVLDAQYVRVDGYGRAVPQRRRRVFVVGHLGSWRRAAAVLFEPESMSWNFAPRREAGQGTSVSVAPCLRAGGNETGGDRPYGTDVDTCDSLIAFGAQNSASQGDGVPVGYCATLDKSKTPAVAFDLRGRDGGAMLEGPHETANMRAASGGSSRSYVAEQWAVRRLTPHECERLQGFPDGYTAVPYRGKPAADGPRYKALGNSMAVNCMRWIGRRIEMVDAISRGIVREAAE